MNSSSTKPRARGFTLVELVVVITIAGIVGTMATYFIVNVMQGYQDQTRRAALVDAAESALRRMQRDVRRALPNSIRRSALNGVPALQSLRVDVQVTGPNEVNVTLSGYRTNF